MESNYWIRDIINGVPEGSRHDSAVRLVGRWYGKGLSRAEVRLILIIWNIYNLPPLSAQELKSIFDSTNEWERSRATPPMSDEEAQEIAKAVKKQIRDRRR